VCRRRLEDIYSDRQRQQLPDQRIQQRVGVGDSGAVRCQELRDLLLRGCGDGAGNRGRQVHQERVRIGRQRLPERQRQRGGSVVAEQRRRVQHVGAANEGAFLRI